MRRIGPVILLAGLLGLAPVARAAAPTPVDLGTSGCSEDSWVGGVTEWCGGRLVYRDYVYDDNGADTQPGSPHGAPLNRATGDVDHRDHGQHLNSADIVSLRLWSIGRQLHVRFELNTLFPDDRTVGVLAIDSDDDDSTGIERLADYGVTAPGIDQLYTFDARNPAPTDPTLGGTIEGAVPMPQAPNGTWDVYAFTALGDGTVMNVAFRGTDETGDWWEGRQADALAEGTVSPFGTEIVARDLLGRKDAPAPLRRGLHERVYRSAYSIGPEHEGVDYDETHLGRNGPGQFSQSFAYLGRIHPYAIYIPDGPAPFGLQLALHGRSAAHASLIKGPGMRRQLGDELHRIIAVPLGRGPFGGYSDWSERDVIDVIADVRATYPIDADRIFSGGYSMGGYGAFRMAAMFPDVFAGAISWVGATGDCLNGTPISGRCPAGAVGNVLEYFDNLRHVPTANLYAVADELVHVHTANAVRERFADLGYRHVFWLHAAEHLTFGVLDDWAKEAAWTKDLVRVRHPARVTFRANTWLDSAALGIVHDRAYWVSGIQADKEGDALVDLTSHACDPRSERTTTLTNGAGPSPVPWVSQEAVDAGPVAITPGPRITGTLTNVATLTLDVTSPCFAADLSGVRTDTATVVQFTDGRQPVTLTP